MKKIVSLALAVLLVLSLAACGSIFYSHFVNAFADNIHTETPA